MCCSFRLDSVRRGHCAYILEFRGRLVPDKMENCVIWYLSHYLGLFPMCVLFWPPEPVNYHYALCLRVSQALLIKLPNQNKPLGIQRGGLRLGRSSRCSDSSQTKPSLVGTPQGTSLGGSAFILFIKYNAAVSLKYFCTSIYSVCLFSSWRKLKIPSDSP